MRRNITVGAAVLAVLLAFAPGAGRAETREIRAAQQYGLSYLPLMIMEDSKLVEAQAQAAGLGGVAVSWVKLGGPSAMNDALLSGSLDFGTGGVPSLITLWSKTRGSADVRGVAALNDMPIDLVTINPDVKTIRDFTAKDKIAVTSVKISTQALLLEMAAAKAFGEKNYGQLDELTVSMPHPDAMIALLSGSGALTAHFSSPPFQYQEKKAPGVRAILNNYDILGGPATFNVVWASGKFYNANPKAYGAFVAALEQAQSIINRDKRAAAKVYKRMTGTKETSDELQAMLADPLTVMTTTPHQVMKTASFMQQVGAIKGVPSAWTELFFPNVHDRPGS